MFKCKTHPRGHKTEEARDKCNQRLARRKARIQKAAKDGKRRESNRANDPEADFIRRTIRREGLAPAKVAARLNRDYPKRVPPWNWAAVIEESSRSISWPTRESLRVWLEAHPKVMLPSEVRKRAGYNVESARD